MSSRRDAALAFVASLLVLVVCLALWVSDRGQGVGTDLERVTLAATSDAGAVAGPQGVDAGLEPSPVTDTSAAGPVSSAPPQQGPRFADVPLADATRIEAPAPVPPPRRVSIPSVDIAMAITATGVTSDGQMELPGDPSRIGWYRFGALPGDARGSVVLGGHVDSVRYGVGPLARLASVREGARIAVTGSDGQRIDYRVASVQRISKAALPVDELFDPEVAHRLVIVTCGGRYLPEAGGYEDNIVVIAEPLR